MPYLFATSQQQEEMLAAIGVASIDELFRQIPDANRLQRPLAIPAPECEMSLERIVRGQAARNRGAGSTACFLGGGAYDHFIPSAVDEITGRGEFYTAYTPYQPEASQGSLQAFFEYQTLVCQLTGMEASNASLYEGGTAISEAAFMAMRITGRESRIVVLGSVHPEFRAVLHTYLHHLDIEIVEVPCPQGRVNAADVEAALNDQTACLIVQHPNFFGNLEDVEQLSPLAREHGALFVVSFDPLSLGLLSRPGDYGADIAVAEGQSLGVPLQYGGPYLGMMACRKDYVRKMPGRLVGKTLDRKGRECFVLNLQAREQHIRRDKATSNICTNQGLLALRATVHLSLLGPQGLREAAELCCRKAHYLAERLAEVPGCSLPFAGPFFKEFVLETSRDITALVSAASDAGFLIGPSLDRFDGHLGGAAARGRLLLAVTEKRTREEMDQLVDVFRRA